MPKVLDSPFFGASISDNLLETQDGFLVCLNVPVARTGTQDYIGSEINKAWGEKIVKAYRLEEDVFHPDTIASFNGKPVTDDHPSVYPVAPENYTIYAKGHAQNARREGNDIVVDLVITDPVLIQKIKSGLKRQVSVGYDCQWVKYKNTVKQTNIRANHIAVVTAGRAGPKYAIKDELPKIQKKGAIMNKKQALAKMFAAFAKDESTTPEELEQVMQYVTDAEPEKKPSEAGLFKKFLAAFDAKAKDEDEEEKKVDDEDKEEKESKEKALDARLEKIEGTLDTLVKALDKAKDEDEEEKVAKDEDETEKAEDEETEEEKKEAKDQALKALMTELKPALATLDSKAQKVVKDALSKALGRETSNVFAEIKKIVASHSPAKDNAPKDLSEIGKKIRDTYNPHYKKA